MTEPQSTKTEPYADFPRQAYTIISDDFCHEKLFVLKPTVKTERSILKLKETVSYKKGAYSLAEELKLWFNLPSAGTLYTKIKSGDYLKVHYDDGVRKIHGKNFFFYAGLNSNKSLDLLSVKLGVGHDSEHCHSDNRLKISNEKGHHTYFWYNRTMVYHNKFRFGFVSCLDVCHKVLQKNNILLGYDVDADTKVFFRAETDGFRHKNASLSHPETIFDKLTFDVVRNVNNTTTAALEASYSLRSKNLENAQAVVQVTKNKQVVKVGLNRYLDVSLLVKRPLKWLDDRATLSAGVGLTGLTKKQVAVKSGFELAVNL